MSEPVFETEAEAWIAIAETLEMTEVMPPWRWGGKVPGLCEVVYILFYDGLISHGQLCRLYDQINLEPRQYDGFVFPHSEWRPRAKLARRFAADCLRGAEYE